MRELHHPLGFFRIDVTLAECRDHFLRDICLGMSGDRAAFTALSTHPSSVPAILLLRTNAICSGKKWIAIPLTIGYVVRPPGRLAGDIRT